MKRLFGTSKPGEFLFCKLVASTSRDWPDLWPGPHEQRVE